MRGSWIRRLTSNCFLVDFPYAHPIYWTPIIIIPLFCGHGVQMKEKTDWNIPLLWVGYLLRYTHGCDQTLIPYGPCCWPLENRWEKEDLKEPKTTNGTGSSLLMNWAYPKFPRWRVRCAFRLSSPLIVLIRAGFSCRNWAQNNLLWYSYPKEM